MRLADIREFMEGFGLFDSYYVGRLDDKKKNSLGVYNLKHGDRHKALGGHERYSAKGVSLLIHGDTNKTRTESLASRLYRRLEGLEGGAQIEIGGRAVYFVELLQDEPVDVEQDSKEIYEYVIELTIYYERQVSDEKS